MDEGEEDINESGDPQEGEDGYPKAGGGYPFLPNSGDLSEEDQQESPADLADEASEINDSIESALSSVEDTQDEDTDPEIPGRGESVPSEESDDYEEPDQPDEPEIDDDGISPIRDTDPLAATSVSSVSSPPLSAGELSSITSTLDSLGGGGEEDQDFGEQLNEFNEAGGADGGGDFGVPGGASDDHGADGGAIGQFADAVVSHASTQDDFLIEHARLLNEMQRRLELERL